MRGDQEFVWGSTLKADLSLINSYFNQLPGGGKGEGGLRVCSESADRSRFTSRTALGSLSTPVARTTARGSRNGAQRSGRAYRRPRLSDGGSGIAGRTG